MVSRWQLRRDCRRKRRYHSQGEANVAAAKAQMATQKQTGYTMQFRPYVCLVCKKWHLTTSGAGYKPGDEDRVIDNE